MRWELHENPENPNSAAPFPASRKYAQSCGMKTYPPKSPRRPRHIRVPAFATVPLRSRADGWTPERQVASW